MRRTAGNRGSFYPRQCSETEQMIASFNQKSEDLIQKKRMHIQDPRAIIVPHAGYIYSGFTANIAYRVLEGSSIKRMVVIGPSHYLYFEGISGSVMDHYETPCGDIFIDRTYLQHLSREHEILFVPEVHSVEHSTETQMPFIRHYFPDTKVIELIYGGRYDAHLLAGIIQDILSDPDNAVVISSDLSHFYTQEEAERLDRICLSGVAQRDTHILDSGCEACGLIGIKALVEVSRKQHYEVELLDYRTSADASGDRERVVGYMSAAMYEASLRSSPSQD